MSHVADKKDGKTYAKYFSNHEVQGTIFIGFRDLPMLVQEHTSGTTTLDYGCGAGVSSRYLKSIGLDVTGVDINADMLKFARDKDPTGKYIEIQSGELPFEDNHFDLVFMSFVLGEVSSKQEIVKILREITRVLKAGGTLIVITPHSGAWNTDWLTVNCDFEENKKLKSGSRFKILLKHLDLIKMDYFWSEEDYCEVISKAGLSIVETYNPLGKVEDGYDFTIETVKPPLTQYVAQKLAETGSNEVVQNLSN